MDHQLSAPESLRRWRESAGKSQTSLAGDLDVRPNTVCEWEKGGRRPDLPNALRLQHLSAGGVPAVAWGYSPEECERLLTAMVSVAQGAADANDAPPRVGAAHTASDFTVDPATADTIPPPARVA